MIIVRRFVLLSFFWLLMASCSSARNSKSVSIHKAHNEMFEMKFSVSARTKLFLKDLEAELLKSGKKLDDFIPSVQLMESYNITKMDNGYHIGGFLSKKESFDKRALHNLGITIGTQTGRLMTIQLPLNTLNEFLKLNGVEYFEISEKVGLMESP